MKKILTLMLLALPLFAMVSCSDDNDLPDVDFRITFDNATRTDDGSVYVVQGETFTVSSIEVINNENKNAIITNANYYWDYFYLGSSVQPPFAFEISLEESTPLGNHVLQIECPVYAEDKEPATALVQCNIVVVASADDIPENGTAAFTVHPSTSSTAAD